MPRMIALAITFSLFAAFSATAQEEISREQQREATIRYGIETQVIELLSALGSEKNRDFDNLLLELLVKSGSAKLRSSLFDYFAAGESGRAVEPAADVIRGRDELQDSLVASAFSYLIKMKSDAALKEASTILRDDERRYARAAVKMLGAAGGVGEAKSLMDAYEAEGVTPELRQEIILALGSIGSVSAFDLLAGIAGDEEAGKVERMYACTALGGLGDDRAVPVLVKAARSIDPNVRGNAVTALGLFQGGAAKEAIIDALRDTHVAPRTAAVKAAASLHLADAVPAIEYKAAYDPERQVRDAALDALADIGGTRAFDFLLGFLENAKNAAQYRVKAFSVLVAKGNVIYRAGAERNFDAAATEKDRSLYLALARAVLAIDDPAVAGYAKKLYRDPEFGVRMAAIAWAERTIYKGHLDELKALAENDPTEAVRKRAAAAIDRLQRN
ncbi:MAG: hypothetical protein E4H20_02400 [Spirochaetales bacterium]|nr:MAG: hypothetical protein E4H20_02400 [Spirochaetales bacterium]